MKIEIENFEDLAAAISRNLAVRLAPDLPGSVLACLLLDRDYLDCGLSKGEAFAKGDQTNAPRDNETNGSGGKLE